MPRDSIYELCDRLEFEAKNLGRALLSGKEAEELAAVLRRYVSNYGPLPRVDANKRL